MSNRPKPKTSRAADKESGVTLQDLINVVAYQELHPEQDHNKKEIEENE